MARERGGTVDVIPQEDGELNGDSVEGYFKSWMPVISEEWSSQWVLGVLSD